MFFTNKTPHHHSDLKGASLFILLYLSYEFEDSRVLFMTMLEKSPFPAILLALVEFGYLYKLLFNYSNLLLSNEGCD